MYTQVPYFIIINVTLQLSTITKHKVNSNWAMTQITFLISVCSNDLFIHFACEETHVQVCWAHNGLRISLIGLFKP